MRYPGQDMRFWKPADIIAKRYFKNSNIRNEASLEG